MNMRLAASIVLLREREQGFEFLLVKKPRKRDSWQFPQGGIEHGETVTQAALRELHEEAGIHPKSVEVLSESAFEYRYEFPASYRRFRPDGVSGQSIRFITAKLLDDSAVFVDGVEIIDYVWVSVSQLQNFIRRKAYLDLALKLSGMALSQVNV